MERVTITVPIEEVHPDPAYEWMVVDEELVQVVADKYGKDWTTNPLTVSRENTNSYIVVSGNLRYLAAKKLGMKQIAVVVQPDWIAS